MMQYNRVTLFGAVKDSVVPFKGSIKKYALGLVPLPAFSQFFLTVLLFSSSAVSYLLNRFVTDFLHLAKFKLWKHLHSLRKSFRSVYKLNAIRPLRSYTHTHTHTEIAAFIHIHKTPPTVDSHG